MGNWFVEARYDQLKAHCLCSRAGECLQTFREAQKGASLHQATDENLWSCQKVFGPKRFHPSNLGWHFFQKEFILPSPTQNTLIEFQCCYIFQAILPVIFIFIPALTFFVIFFGKLSVGSYGSLAFAVINWQPCIHPLLSLWFIGPFRKRIINRVVAPQPTC